jgi:hut operon positive regulator
MEAFLQGESVKSVGVAAMLLALTRTLKDEETAKRALTEVGHKFVVTEVGGKTSRKGEQGRNWGQSQFWNH